MHADSLLCILVMIRYHCTLSSRRHYLLHVFTINELSLFKFTLFIVNIKNNNDNITDLQI